MFIFDHAIVGVAIFDVFPSAVGFWQPAIHHSASHDFSSLTFASWARNALVGVVQATP